MGNVCTSLVANEADNFELATMRWREVHIHNLIGQDFCSTSTNIRLPGLEGSSGFHHSNNTQNIPHKTDLSFSISLLVL